jgi:flavin reductase (DIM6/NTAB) family NADH-FMN oxidoreductase RutF
MDIDPKALRTAFGQFMTGVTVVTTRRAEGDLVGFTANSFSSVSLDPPLLLVCPGAHLSSYETFSTTPHFAVSILAEGQETVSNTFAKSGADRFGQIAHSIDGNGSPLIDGRAAGFSCQTFQRVRAGDHMILIGRITGFDRSGRAPLGYCADGYFSLSKERQADAAASRQKATQASVILRQGDTVLLDAQGHLPGVAVAAGDGARSALRSYLGGLGLSPHLGPVYSVYDETAQVRRKVLLGRLPADHAPAPFTAHPIRAIAGRPQQNAALDTMLARFAAEHQSQSFGLYIGDAQQGEIHSLTSD